MKKIAAVILIAVLLLSGCSANAQKPQEVNLSKNIQHELKLPKEYAQRYDGHSYGKRLGCDFVYDSEYFYMLDDLQLTAVSRKDCSETLLADVSDYCGGVYEGIADVFAVTPDSVLCYYYDQTGVILSVDKRTLKISTHQLDGIQNTGMMRLEDGVVYYVNQLDYGVYAYDIKSGSQKCIYKKDNNTLIASDIEVVGDNVFLRETDEDEWNENYVKIKKDGSGFKNLNNKKDAADIAWFNLHDYNYKNPKSLEKLVKKLKYQDIDMVFTGGLLGKTSAGVYYVDNDLTVFSEKSSEQYELGSTDAVSSSAGESVYRKYTVKSRTISNADPKTLFSFVCDAMNLSHEVIICANEIYYYDVDISSAKGQWKRYDI